MQLLPTDEELMEMRFASHGSCALVGASTHLLRKELGAEIDAHEVIIRINDAPTKVSFVRYCLSLHRRLLRIAQTHFCTLTSFRICC